MQGLTQWLKWSNWLEKRGLAEPAAIFLDAAGPLNLLLAQFVYLIQPFMEDFVSHEETSSLAALLENSSRRREFAILLRGEMGEK